MSQTEEPASPALIASTGRPGRRILAGLAAAAWTYLDLVADSRSRTTPAAWGSVGGLAGVVVGAVLAVSAVIGDAPRWAVGGHPSKLAG